jgi:hypothetical protein
MDHEAELQFHPGARWLLETAYHAAYLVPVVAGSEPPIALIDRPDNARPLGLKALFLDEGRTLMTVTLDSSIAADAKPPLPPPAAQLTTDRWIVDVDTAIRSLREDSPFCLEPGWRVANLRETDADAKARHCACRAAYATSDETCGGS